MMFISTVVHLFEIILLSLLGIMFYKLFASYRKWKNTSVSASSKGGDRSTRLYKPAMPQNPDYLSVSKITVTEEQPANSAVKEKQSTVILKDYIGEFFAQSKPMDLEPYRANQPEQTSASSARPVTAVNPMAPVLNEMNDDDDVIQVFSPANVAHSLVVSNSSNSSNSVVLSNSVVAANNVIASNNASISDDSEIPILRNFLETDSDSFITVSSGVSGENANNIMSDKVVMAMLHEAKLVCAS